MQSPLQSTRAGASTGANGGRRSVSAEGSKDGSMDTCSCGGRRARCRAVGASLYGLVPPKMNESCVSFESVVEGSLGTVSGR